MNNSILVSCVVTTYKREPSFVVRAVQSILNQTYGNIEVTVVDDSPSNWEGRKEVETVLSELPKVRYIKHDCTRGACAARNTGLFHSHGEFIGFLDDDDEWRPEKVATMLPLFSDPEVAVVYCGALGKYASGKTTEIIRKWQDGNIYDSLIRENFVGSTSFPLIRRSSLIEIGGFDIELKSCQDYDVWLRLAKNHKFAYVKNVLVNYYLHEGVQITKNVDSAIQGHERINQKNQEYIKGSKKVYWARNIVLCPLYARKGEYSKAITTWISSFIRCPLNCKKNIEYLYSIIIEYKQNRKKG